jgi:tRNA (guanine-N7-)-methyltransferase
LRQRKVRNVEERIAKHHQYLAEDPKEQKGKWQQVFKNDNPIFAEFGSGKGQFIIALAEQNPDRNYIAIECRKSIILRVLEKVKEQNISNIVVLYENIVDVNEYFDKDELSGIYLNFSDPWPKNRHAKRRLTNINYLEGYKRVLKPGCFIEVKTDRDDLFAYTVNEFQKTDMKVINLTDDLHSTELEAKLVTTEYEDKFHRGGKNINYCKVQVE